MKQLSPSPSVHNSDIVNANRNINRSPVKSKPVFNKQSKRKCNSIMDEMDQMGKIEGSIVNCITALQKEPVLRTTNDLSYIKAFLETSGLGKKLFNDLVSNESVRQILIMCGTEMRHQFVSSNQTLFRIGDEGKHFYIIIKGSCEILKTTTVTKSLTGFQYFEYLITNYDNKETYLVTQTLKANNSLYPIDYSIMPSLKPIVLFLLIDGYFGNRTYKRKQLLAVIKNCHIDLSKLSNIDLEEEDNDYIEDIDAFLKDYLKQVAHIKIDNFIFLKNNVYQEKLTLYEYQKFMELHDGAFFGDSALDKKTVRNATIRTSQDTHFCYLDIQNYTNYLLVEKKRLGSLEISFLGNYFFFKNISYAYFERKYFSSFIDEEYFKNEYLCYEGQSVKYVYFVRYGQIELTSQMNVLQLHSLTDRLTKILNNGHGNDSESNDCIRNCSNDFAQLVNYFKKKLNNRLFIINDKEVIGAECFFYGINYIFTARVISKRAKVYKIELKDLLKLMQAETRCYEPLQQTSQKKLRVFIQRLSEIKNSHIGLMDNSARTDNLLAQMKNSNGNNVDNNVVKSNDLPNIVFKSFKTPRRRLSDADNNKRTKDNSTSPHCFLTEYAINTKKILKSNRVLIKNACLSSSIQYPKINSTSLYQLNKNKRQSVYNLTKGKNSLHSRSTNENTPVSLLIENKILSKIQKELKQYQNKIYPNSLDTHETKAIGFKENYIHDSKRQAKSKQKNTKKCSQYVGEIEPNLHLVSNTYYDDNNNNTIFEEEEKCFIPYNSFSLVSLSKRFSGKYFQQKNIEYKQFKTKTAYPI